MLNSSNTVKMIRPKRTIQKPKRFLKFLLTKPSKSIDGVQAISQPVEPEGRRTSIAIAAIGPPVINGSTDGEVNPTNSIEQKPATFSLPHRVIDTSNNMLRPKRTIQKPRRFLEYLPPESLKPIDAVEAMSHPVEHGCQQTSTSIITTTNCRPIEAGSAEHTHAIDKDATCQVSALFSTEAEQVTVLHNCEADDSHNIFTGFHQPNLIDVSCNTLRPKRTIQKPKRFANFLLPESSKSIEAISQPAESVINEVHAPNLIAHSVEAKSHLGRRANGAIIKTTDRPVGMGSDEHTRVIDNGAAGLISSLISTGEQVIIPNYYTVDDSYNIFTGFHTAQSN